MQVGKTLTANDLGLTGSHQAGILVPKSGHVLRIFPPLDEHRLNPDCEVAFWVAELGRTWTARFVYYNNRAHGMGTRSEYRLTRISGLLKDLRANVGDRLVFTQDALGAVSVELKSRDERDLSQSRRLRNGWTMSVEDEG